MTSPVDVLKDLFCGCCSGWTQVFTMLPFQNIKLKVVTRPLQYHGYIHAFKKTVAQEGFLSFYKGMLMPLIGVGAQVAVQFGTVETLKKIFKVYFGQADGSLNWKYSVLSGVICGFPSALVVTPLDHSRFRVALTKQKGEGSIKTAVNIYRQYGIRKLYLGLNSTILRESFLGVYFGTYDFCTSFFRTDGKVSKIGSFLSGGLAGMATWASLYPVDLVKTKVQADSLENPQFKNAIDCFRKQLQKGNLKSFYVGFQIMLFRAFFVNACGFMAFQFAKKALY